MPVNLDSINPTKAAAEGSGVLAGGLLRYGLALLYGFAICYAYKALSVWWAYFGFTYRLDSEALLFEACFAAAVPAILLHPRPRTFAESTAWFLYIIVFLPCLLVPVMQYSAYGNGVGAVFGATFIACLLFVSIVRGDVSRIPVRTISQPVFWGGLGSIWLGMLVLILLSFGASFKIVGADDIYSQRFLGAESAANPAVRYSIAILSGAIDPFLVAAGLYSKRYWLSCVGVASQVVLFGTLAARSTLLSPIFVIGIYFLSDRDRRLRGNLLLTGLIAICILTAPLMENYDPGGGFIDQLLSLLYLRTLLIAGAAYGVYDQFFSIFPVTYFSNIHPINYFVAYPYGDLSVGQVVQSFLMPITSTDVPELNANFLATDGMASLGLLGVPFAGALTAFILRFFSRFVPRERTMFMVAAAIGFMLSLSNGSLFTSLVTGGGLIVVALVCVAPIKSA